MAALDCVDIRSLMETPMYWQMNDPFKYEDPSARGAGKPRCGVCLFPLVGGATASNVDADEDLSLFKSSWATSTRREFRASAARGCTYCASILSFAHDNGAIELKLSQRDFWRGIVIIKDLRGSHETFVFLAPPGKTHEDLDGGKHSSIGRGVGAASIKCSAENEVLDKARSWWETCSEKHDCRTGPRCDTPTRLLRLEHSPDENATVVWLVEGITQPAEYVALSHRWSEETKIVSLVNSNWLERIEKGMSSTDLPRLMQDTIHVLRRFGIEYLWIDCLCIIQGDSADWKREAASMASVYKNAAFTISAIHCLGSSESLFSDPKRALAAGFVEDLPGGIPVHLEQRIRHPFSYNRMYFKAGVGHVRQPHCDEYIGSVVIDTDPSLNLLSRGWVYQEVLLCPRTLYFLANEIMWWCRANTICQCARYALDSDWAGQSDSKAFTHDGETLYYSERGSRPVASRDWATIVEDYSSKALTYPKDRLPALAGIAQEFGIVKGWTYICGLWHQDLSRTFGWTRSSDFDTHAPESGLPTWSWASTATNVRMDIVCSDELEFQSCHITYKDGGLPFLGDVEEAVLNVRGDAFPAKLVPPSFFAALDSTFGSDDASGSEGTSPSFVDERWGVSIYSSVETRLDADRILLPETSMAPHDDVLCLILNPGNDEKLVPFHCLVLRGIDHHTDRYQRLGVIRIPTDEKQGDWRTRWGVSRRRLALV